jgi:UDP-N-acetylmuramate dehydrogenase
LKTSRETLLEVVFHPQPGDPALIRRKVSANLESRAKKLPSWDTACAGSYFKNPSLPDGTRTAAGSLLEQVGAKDLRVGDAAVFSGHANIIINRGKATAREVLDLAGILKDKVRDRFGFELEEEVVYLPAESSLS